MDKKTCEICQLKEMGFTEDEILQITINKQTECVKKYGFYTHYVLPAGNKMLANYHTHGLEKTRNHLDFQIVLPINPELAHSIIWNFIKRINKGEKFEPNTKVENIIKGFPVKLIEATEGNRKVLRIILPDPNGKFPNEKKCNEFYKKQIENLKG